jgi:hypothetical protein
MIGLIYASGICGVVAIVSVCISDGAVMAGKQSPWWLNALALMGVCVGLWLMVIAVLVGIAEVL